ncbi:hypothetical protein LTR08_002503 [Meristemomyces frigidus]|nr:hypothetical protein LTR08_002503 [Meristemomyces frigidus]
MLILLATLLRLAVLSEAKLRTCKARNLPAIDVFGLEVLDVSARAQHGYPEASRDVPVDAEPIDFCNVTITYTHPGQNDTINAYIWLPFDHWNGKLLGQGGGAWASGDEASLAASVALGYAGTTSDSGHSIFGDVQDVAVNAEKWALLSPGNMNWALVQDFAARALDDLPKIAKQIVKGFYGEAPSYSYWNGCSTGGRQGLMSAQRFPGNYDGILAVAPAISWASLAAVAFWPQVVMQREKYWPPACELEAIRQAAVKSCDEIDGVKDGIIAAPGLCLFNANTIVGSTFDCEGAKRNITAAAARIANAIWGGPVRTMNGQREWYGITHGTSFGGSGPYGVFDGLATTTCADGNDNCHGNPFPVSATWIQYFIEKDPDYDVTQMSEDDFFRALHRSRNEYGSIMDTSDPDLSEFKALGGKIVHWHGLADQLISPNGSSSYYSRVLALDPEARDFYRYFEAPGVKHCAGGIGAFPGNALEALVNWVENGAVPERLEAASIPAGEGEKIRERVLCPWPLVAAFKGGDVDAAGSYECEEVFGQARGLHTEL